MTNAYLEQCEAIEAVGGRIILMASRALAAVARHADDYASVYATVLAQVRQPVILHWLGPMFDPALEGYWGATAISAAMENCLSIIRAHKEKIDGIKISLLDADLEISMRRQLPAGCTHVYRRRFQLRPSDSGRRARSQRRVAGDLRCHCASRIAGAERARCWRCFPLPATARAHRAALPPHLRVPHATLQDRRRVPGLSQWISVSLPHGARQESARSVAHLCELFVLADQAGVLRDPELAVQPHAELSASGRCRMSIASTPQLQSDHRRSLVSRASRQHCSRSGIPYIGVWRHKLDGDAAKASALIRSAGLRVSSLCRGGWFSAPTAEERRKRIADNRIAIEEAALLGAPVLVIVSGPANGQTLADARATVLDGLLEVLPDAEKAGVVLGIEPLHPMYAAERSVVVTLKQANDIAEQLRSPSAGVVMDAFHVWWDPEVMHEIERARGKIAGFHVLTGPCLCPASSWAAP